MTEYEKLTKANLEASFSTLEEKDTKARCRAGHGCRQLGLSKEDLPTSYHNPDHCMWCGHPIEERVILSNGLDCPVGDALAEERKISAILRGCDED